MCPWLTDLCLSKLELIAFKLRPCALWTLRIHDNISGNWLQRMTGDDILNLFLYIDAFSLFFGTHLLFLAIMSFPLIRFCPADMSSKVYPLSHPKQGLNYSVRLTNTCEGVVYLVNAHVRSLQLYKKWASLHLILKNFVLVDVFKEYVKTYFPDHLLMIVPKKNSHHTNIHVHSEQQKHLGMASNNLKVENKDTRKTLSMSFWCVYC